DAGGQRAARGGRVAGRRSVRRTGGRPVHGAPDRRADRRLPHPRPLREGDARPGPARDAGRLTDGRPPRPDRSPGALAPLGLGPRVIPSSAATAARPTRSPLTVAGPARPGEPRG